MHSIKTRIISSYTKNSISIDKFFLSKLDYFFKFIEAKISIYSHIVNTIISVILIRNDNVKSIKIFKNFWLNKLIEIEHFNILYVKSKPLIFVIRIFKSKRKNLFLNKPWKSTLLIYKKNNHTASVDVCLLNKNIDSILFNDITIYNLSEKIVFQKFSDLIENVLLFSFIFSLSVYNQNDYNTV